MYDTLCVLHNSMKSPLVAADQEGGIMYIAYKAEPGLAGKWSLLLVVHGKLHADTLSMTIQRGGIIGCGSV